LKGVLEECMKEPAFLTYTLHTYPDRPVRVPTSAVFDRQPRHEG
jgi:hypothetical protein